jgi:hypothetical protein
LLIIVAMWTTVDQPQAAPMFSTDLRVVNRLSAALEPKLAIWASAVFGQNSMWFGLRSSELGPTVSAVSVSVSLSTPREGTPRERAQQHRQVPADNRVSVMRNFAGQRLDTSARGERRWRIGKVSRAGKASDRVHGAVFTVV